MKYKILLPVSSPAELVKQKLNDLKGYEENLIIINNWFNEETEKYVQIFADMGAEAWNCKYNLGLATSWNFGLKRMIEDNCDFVLILSASALFLKNIQYFIDKFLEYENKSKNYFYIADVALLHCFIHTKDSVKFCGFYDENFWPIYFEDTDMSYRIKIKNLTNKRISLSSKDIVYSDQYSKACNSDPELMKLHQYNCGRWHKYYLNKWGGDHLSEKYLTPFNNPTVDINFWEVKELFYHTILGENYTVPIPSTRYEKSSI